MKNRIAYFTALMFLVVQIVLIVYSRFVPERFFCWSPYDEHNSFEVYVTIGDKELSFDEVKERYQYKSNGWEARTIHNIFSIIKQYENSYGKADKASVRVVYTKNGHDEQIWEHHAK